MWRIAFAISLVACTTSPADVATGVVGAWTAGPALTTPRANHCSAVIDDWVLVIGGNYASGTDFVKTDEIAASRIAADGTLGAWQVAGHTPSPVSECTATSDGRHLYVIDGLYDDVTDNGQVWSADLDPAGNLPALTSIGALPDGVVAISSDATVRDGMLLLMNTRLPTDTDDPDTTLTLRTPLTGTMTWTTDTWTNVDFRDQAQYAFTDSFAYTLGGYHDPAVGAVADTFFAPIGAKGAIGTAVPAAALPAPTAFGEAVAVDDWLFVIGGRAQVFTGAGVTDVYAAHLAADGSFDSWQVATALPIGRTNHTVVLAGDFLVLTGGATSGGGDTTVLVSRVRYPAQ